MRERLAQVSFDEAGDALVAAVQGEIDGSNAAEVQRSIADRVPTSARALIMDLSGAAYIDSTGVELLFELARRLMARRQALLLVVPSGSGVRRVLELCDVGSVGALVETVDDAVTTLARRDGGSAA